MRYSFMSKPSWPTKITQIDPNYSERARAFLSELESLEEKHGVSVGIEFDYDGGWLEITNRADGRQIMAHREDTWIESVEPVPMTEEEGRPIYESRMAAYRKWCLETFGRESDDVPTT